MHQSQHTILQMGTDKMILRHVYDKSFAITFSNRSEWKYQIQLNRKEEPSGAQMNPRQMMGLGLECMVLVQSSSLASALDNTPQHSRHVQRRI
jgi:hypothetical protein